MYKGARNRVRKISRDTSVVPRASVTCLEALYADIPRREEIEKIPQSPVPASIISTPGDKKVVFVLFAIRIPTPVSGPAREPGGELHFQTLQHQ